jgi:CPA2 family monovalent cation:H+ antiporter-2
MLAKSVLAELPGVPPALPPEGVTRVDTSRLVHYAVPADACPHAGVSAPVLPSAMGCEECLRAGDRWVHLRLCLTCGHVGCCDSTPGRHARAHGDEHEHPYIASLEPGEAWAHCFLDATTVPRPARSGWDTATGTARTADRTEERA